MRNLASLVLLAAPLSAAAQPGAPGLVAPAPIPERQGLELGLGVWGGNMQCESQNSRCDGFSAAGGGNLDVSYFFRPTLGVTFDAWAMAHTEDNLTLTHTIATLGIKWRPMPALTLHAGVGSAHASWDFGGAFTARTDDAPAVMAAIAFDVIRARRWAVSVEGRVGTGFYGDDNNDGMADITARNEALGAQLAFFGF
jgi:hypothetical protein